MTRPKEYRRKSLFVLFFKVGGLQVLGFFMWIAMFGFAGVVVQNSARQFAEEGEAAQARVIDKYFEYERRGNERKKRNYLELEYEILAGEHITLKRSVRSSDYQDFNPGDVIQIRYLRSDPRKIEIQPGRTERQGRFLSVVTLFSAFAAMASIWFHGRRAIDAIRAREIGKVEQVRLIETRKHGRWLFSQGYQLIWRDGSGEPGKSLPQKAAKLMGFRPGDTLIVYHGRKRSWWAGDVGDRADA